MGGENGGIGVMDRILVIDDDHHILKVIELISHGNIEWRLSF
jgi:hypothetical protein